MQHVEAYGWAQMASDFSLPWDDDVRGSNQQETPKNTNINERASISASSLSALSSSSSSISAQARTPIGARLPVSMASAEEKKSAKDAAPIHRAIGLPANSPPSTRRLSMLDEAAIRKAAIRSNSAKFRLELSVLDMQNIIEQKDNTADKIVLPSNAIELVHELRLPYPLLFTVSNACVEIQNSLQMVENVVYRTDAERSGLKFKQVCSVLEFSASDGYAYMPQWMMQNLLLEEGDAIVVEHLHAEPGNYACFQVNESFLSLLEENGPKAFLEHCLRNFTALRKGSRIMIHWQGQEHYLNIIETRPRSTIQIIGADLEVDFVPFTDGMPETFQKHSELDRAIADSTSNSNACHSNNASDGSWGDAQPTQAIASRSLAANVTFSYDEFVESSDESDDEVSKLQPGFKRCPNCGKGIITSSFDLHTMHCARNFIRCTLCSKVIKKSEKEKHDFRHEKISCHDCNDVMERRRMKWHRSEQCAKRKIHCDDCDKDVFFFAFKHHRKQCLIQPYVCDLCQQSVLRKDKSLHASVCMPMCKCGERYLLADSDAHKSECSHRKVACQFCELPLKARELHAHELHCGNRTELCGFCSCFIKLHDMEKHLVSSCSYPPPAHISTTPCSDESASDNDERIQSQQNLQNDVNNDIHLTGKNDRFEPISVASHSNDNASNRQPPSVSSHASDNRARTRNRINATNIDTFPCPYCSSNCYDEESLHLHMLTVCYEFYEKMEKGLSI